MYRIQQQLVSWVCSNLADIAEVNPDNIAPSLTSGSITLSSVNLRTNKINKHSPLHVADGKIGHLCVSIPWLSRVVHPITVVVDGLEVNMTLVTSEKNNESEEDLIELEDIIGTDESDDFRASVHRSNSAASDDDDDDFHSCKSDTESMSSGSDSDDDSTPATGTAQGLFRSVASRVANYVAPSFFSPRPVSITVNNVRLILRPHVGSPFGFCIEITSISINIEPNSQTSNTSLRIVKMMMKGIRVTALSRDPPVEILCVDAASIIDTTTCDSLGSVIAKNIHVAMEENGVDISLPSPAIDSMLKCSVSFLAFSRTPPFARPFLPLRQSRSRWSFARAAVLALVSDRKRRWNFNLSHIRAFSIARRHYLDLLDRCHRDCALSDTLRVDIRATEHELVYRDVVEALKNVTMTKFDRRLRPKDTNATRSTAQSLHIGLGAVRVSLPNNSRCRITAITAVNRDNELTLTINGMLLNVGSGRFESCTNSEVPFINIRTTSDTQLRSVVTACELQSVTGSTSFVDVFRTIRPFVACLNELTQEQRRSADRVTPAPTTQPRNTINALFHQASLSVDDFKLDISKSSLSLTSGGSDGRSVFAFGLAELSLCHRGAYVLSPVSIHTAGTNKLRISPVIIELPQSVIDDCTNIGKLLGSELPAPASPQNVPAVASQCASVPLQSILAIPENPVKMAAEFEIESVRIEVLPLGVALGLVSLSCGVSGEQTLVSAAKIEITLAELQVSVVDMRLRTQQLSSSDKRVAIKSLVKRIDIMLLDTSLAAMGNCTIGMCDGDLAAEVNSAMIGSGVMVSPLKFAATRIRDAVPSRSHPYHASNVFVLANIDRVDVPMLATHRGLQRVGGFVNEIVVPMAQKFMSPDAQQLFMSGLSNLTLHLTASKNEIEPCEIIFGSNQDNKLRVSLSHRSGKHDAPSQSSRDAPRGSVISVMNHCHALSVEIQAASMHVMVALDADPSEWTSLTIEGARIIQPMSVLEYWTDDCVHEVSPPERSFEAAKISMEYNGPSHGNCKPNAVECVTDKLHARVSQALQEDSTVVKSIHFHTTKVRLHSQLSSQKAFTSSVKRWETVFAPKLISPTPISSSCNNTSWESGQVEIAAPHEVIQLDHCEFKLSAPISINVDSMCVFRKCTFYVKTSADVIRAGDEDHAVFEDCVVHCETQVKSTDSSVIPRVAISSDHLSISLSFGFEDQIRLRLSDARAQYSSGDTVHLRCQYSVALASGEEIFSMIEHASCSLDGTLSYAHQRLRLSLHVALGTFRLPIHLVSKLSHSVSAFSDILADAADSPKTISDPIEALRGWTWYLDAAFPLHVSACLRDGTEQLTLIASHMYFQSQRATVTSKIELNIACRARLSVFDPALGHQLEITEDDLHITLCVSHDKNLNIDGTLHPCSVSLSDAVIQVVQSLCSFSKEEASKPTLTITNELGTPVQLQFPRHGSEWLSTIFEGEHLAEVRICDALSFRLTNFHHDFVSIGEWRNVFLNDFPFPRRIADVAVCGGLIVRFSLETSRTLRQHLTIHTLVSVFNRLPNCSLLMTGSFKLSATREEPLILPCTRRHVPIYLIDDPSFQLCLSDNPREPAISFGTSARSIVQRCVNEGPANLGRRHIVASSALPQRIIDASIGAADHTTQVTTINILPGLPTIINHLPFSITIRTQDEAGLLLREYFLGMGENCHLYCLENGALPSQLEVEFVSSGGTFVSTEPLSLSDVVNEEEVCVMMRNSVRTRHCLELAVIPSFGLEGCTLSVTCSTGFVLTNTLEVEVVIASDQGFPLGACGDKPIPPRGVSLLPTTTPLIIDVERSNGEFSIDADSGNQTIVCAGAPHYGHCIYVVPHSKTLPGDGQLPTAEAKRDVTKRSWRSWNLIPPLEVRNDTDHTMTLLHLVAPVSKLQDTIHIQDVIVPPHSTASVCKLALSGFRDVFTFTSNDVRSEPVAFPMLPESSDIVDVPMGENVFRVTFVKGIPCSTAVLSITCISAPIIVFNATATRFGEFPPFSYTRVSLAPRVNLIQLTTATGDRASLPLENDEWVDLLSSNNVCGSVRRSSNQTRVIISRRDRQLQKVKVSSVPLTVNVNLNRFFLTIVSKGQSLFCTGFESVSLWVKEASGMWTLQASASDLEVRNLLESCAILSPVRSDLTLQDIVIQPQRQICVRSIRANVTRLELNVSDRLLAELAQLKERLSPPLPIESIKTLPHQRSASVALLVQSIAIAELHLVFSWDRNGNSEQSKVLRRLAGFLTFIGSVNSMTLTLPMFQLDNGTPTNALDIMTLLSKHYIASLLLHAGRVISSFKAVGSPLAWASGLIAGVHSAIASDAVRRALSAPLSLFGGSLEKLVSDSLVDSVDGCTADWVCTCCSRVHDAIVGRCELTEIARRFGSASLRHHCSEKDRLKYLRNINAPPHIFFCVLCSMNATADDDDTVPQAMLEVDLSHEQACRQTAHVLFAGCATGVLPPFYDDWWIRVQASWKPQ